ncbi:MAG: hypothetical protein ACYTG7_24920, partial [Planctomycetota bacterium]
MPGTRLQPYTGVFGDSALAPTLLADTHEISETAGGQVNFSLKAGEDQANRTYLLLGTVSGTDPGTPLPGGLATLPLNWDPFTDVVLLLLNSPVFLNFLGSLDANGQAS